MIVTEQQEWRPEALKRAREIFGHSQEDAARIMEVSWATVQRWEAGTMRPTGLYAKTVFRYIESAEETDEARRRVSKDR